MCVCSGASWGWMANDPVSDLNWLIHMLVDVVTRDGNILLNVAPDGKGAIPQAVQNRVRELGQWLKENGDSIYGTRGGPIEPVDRVYGTTSKEDHIYLHIQDREAFADCTLPLEGYRVLECTYGGEKIPYTQEESSLRVMLPEGLPRQADTIVKLRVDRPVEPKKDAEVYFTGK